MSGNVLDIVLLAAIALFAISGYRQGFVVGVLSFAGFLGGGILGTVVAPPIAEELGSGTGRALIGIAVVLVVASLGQLIGTSLGAAIRRRVTLRPLRLADSGGGAAVSVVSVLIVAWLLGTAVAQSPFVGLATEAKHSRVLRAVDAVMPPAPALLADFRDLLDQRGFPQVFADLRPDRGAPVPPPDPALARSRAVRAAQSRVLKIVGTARSCSRRVEGTGFVYAPKRMMTNAHVVAGVRDPTVAAADGRRLNARVVLFNPDRDVAVLYVPDLDASPLVFDGGADKGDSAIVVGYPLGGEFRAEAARVREEVTAVGRDIYQRRTVRRSVYSIRARVRSGNSGGPLLATDGRVYGVIFAAAADDESTGYALTAAEVAGDARAGATRTQAVSTQTCD